MIFAKFQLDFALDSGSVTRFGDLLDFGNN